jgi:Asp-tRNA(Asn)/Glu-tRNA(Gln) amidotransferase A subunit family amidase
MHAGCTIAPVDVPDLELCRVAHSVTVSSEAIQRSRWALNNRQFYRQLGPDVRITFAAAKFFTAADYVQAQCIRRRMTANLAHACKKTDILVTPATPCTAPVCHAAALRCGESDLRMVSQLMKYMQLSNFIGAPAVVVPVGLDDTGLPIGYAHCHFFWGQAGAGDNGLQIGYARLFQDRFRSCKKTRRTVFAASSAHCGGLAEHVLASMGNVPCPMTAKVSSEKWIELASAPFFVLPFQCLEWS